MHLPCVRLYCIDMKRFTRIVALAVALIAVVVNTSAKSYSEKDFRKLIARYDVADTVMHAPSAGAFWSLLQRTNRNYLDAYKSLSGDGDKDLKRDMQALLAQCGEYFRNVPTRLDLEPMAEEVVQYSGLRAINPIAILSVTREPDVAFFGYSNGYIFMTEGLYNMVNGNPIDIQSLFACEAAHSALQHVYAHARWEKKRRNRARFWGIFGAAVLTTVTIAATHDCPDCTVDAIWFGAMLATMVINGTEQQRYLMQYTPEQIFEADIVAYRFMEWAGYGDAYIRALQRAGYAMDAENPLGDEAPDVSARIALLRYMAANPNLRHKVKANNLASRLH